MVTSIHNLEQGCWQVTVGASSNPFYPVENNADSTIETALKYDYVGARENGNERIHNWVAENAEKYI